MWNYCFKCFKKKDIKCPESRATEIRALIGLIYFRGLLGLNNVIMFDDSKVTRQINRHQNDI